MYLMHERELGSEHAHQDADVVEHFLPPDVLGRLEQLLAVHQRQPGLPPSIHATAGQGEG
jgi:Mn-dependent DtxR family transcriptional regulator